MNLLATLALLVATALIVSALHFKTLRKTVGLLLVILGGMACFTVIGIVIGVPVVLVGGVFLFI